MPREITVEIPTLHVDQIKAYDVCRENRFFALRCGRRYGKTAFLSAIASSDAVKGKRVAYMAPDYKRLTETYNEIERILSPIKKSSSQTQGTIRTVNDGVVEFWTLGDESAGRSRKYHTVLIDEAAFTKSPAMFDIWRKSIKPTLLDYRGRCIVASNTSGTDQDNFFWKITNEPEHGFVEYWAPSINNPYLPAEDIETLRKTEHPDIFAQEYEAVWVDWSGKAPFPLESLLVDGKPVQFPERCDCVLAVIDSAVKTGSANDATGVLYVAVNSHGVSDAPKLTFLDWDIKQIEGSLLEVWMPEVFRRLEELSRECKARMGSVGAYIEDAVSGTILLQQCRRHGWPAHGIKTELTAKGKDGRALNAVGYVHRGWIKLSQHAFDKNVAYKGAIRNHLISQVCSFRFGDKDAATRADDLLDCATYSVSIALGDQKGF